LKKDLIFIPNVSSLISAFFSVFKPTNADDGAGGASFSSDLSFLCPLTTSCSR